MVCTDEVYFQFMAQAHFTERTPLQERRQREFAERLEGLYDNPLPWLLRRRKRKKKRWRRTRRTNIILRTPGIWHPRPMEVARCRHRRLPRRAGVRVCLPLVLALTAAWSSWRSTWGAEGFFLLPCGKSGPGSLSLVANGAVAGCG